MPLPPESSETRRTATRWSQTLLSSPWTLNTALAAGMLVFGILQLADRGRIPRGPGGPPPFTTDLSHYLLLGGAAGALILRTKAPILTLALVVTFGVPFLLLDPRQLALLPIIVTAIYTVVANALLSRWQAWGTALAAGIALGTVVVFSGPEIGFRLDPIQTTTVMSILAAVFLGDAARSRRALTLEAERRALDAERASEEQALHRVSEERLQIARELHDIVAHNIALITVQAGVAAHLREREPERVQEAFESIRTISQATLQEMRALVGVLREPLERPSSVPTVGLAGLDALVDRVRGAGIEVEVSVEDLPTRVPATVDVSAYRILQEALTNAVSHGSSGAVRLRIDREGRDLRLEVENTVASTVGRTDPLGGHGIEGMRERVRALGGTLEAGLVGEGRFRITARLPLPIGRSS